MSSWVKTYQKYIYTEILPKLLPDTNDPDIIDKRKKLVMAEPMKVWIRAITDRSYNPNQTENYESLEFLGDTEMGNNFTVMIIKQYPDVNETTLTQLKNTQVWKYAQADLSDKLGLTKYILTIFPITTSKKEDILEALFGAIRLIGDKYLGPGQGSIMSYNMVVYLYKDISIDFSLQTLKNSKEKFREIADKLDWFGTQKKLSIFGDPIESKTRTGALLGYKLTYKLNDKAVKWLLRKGHKIVKDGIVAEIEDQDKSVILIKGADEAVANLKRYYDIDWNYAEKYRTELQEQYPNALLVKMQGDGYVNLSIRDNKIAKKPVRPVYTQLLGKKENGEYEVILTIQKDADVSMNTIRQILYDTYIKEGKQPLRKIIVV